MLKLPASPRVVVVGTSCSGKTTFSRALASALHVALVELDELHWLPGWREKPRSEFSRLVAHAAAGTSWVVDGNYLAVSDILWPRANLVIWLNYSLALVLWRGIVRSIKRSLCRETLWHGNQESFRRSFLSKESILLWIITTHKLRVRQFNELRASAKYPNIAWLEFRYPAHAKRWLSEVSRTA
jgi:adenylate kinase family enzyme